MALIHNRALKLLILPIIVAFAASSWAQAQESEHLQLPEATLQIERNSEHQTLSGASEFLRDPSGKLTLDAFLAQPREQAAQGQHSWLPLAPGSTNFDWTADTYWIRARLQNAGPEPLLRYLMFLFARIDQVDAYLWNGNELIHHRAGLMVPHHEWPVDHNRLTIPLHLPPQGAITLYLRVANYSVMNLEASLVTEEQLHKLQRNSVAIFWGFSTAMGVTFLLTIVFIFAFREMQYVTLLGHIGFSYLMVLSVNNLDFQILYPTSSIAPMLKTFYGGVTVLLLLPFLSKTLNISKTDWRHKIIVFWLLMMSPFVAFGMFLHAPWFDQFAALQATFAFPTCLVLIATRLKKSSQAPYLLVGFSGYLISMAVYVPSVTGIYTGISVPESLPSIGMFSHVILICLGILQRIIRIKNSLKRRNHELSVACSELKSEHAARVQILSELEMQRRINEESEKLKIMGEVSRNIAHEINTPLSILSLKIQNLQAFMAKGRLDEGAVNNLCDGSLKIIKRMSSIVRVMRLLARDKRNDSVTAISAAALIEQLHIIYDERAIDAGIRFTTLTTDNNLIFEARESAMLQILSNLINNSFQAFKGSPVENKWVELTVIDTGEHIAFTVSDNGQGIRDKDAAHIFEPLFTTKAGSDGTGIGLSLSRSAARDYGGDLILYRSSNPTKFVCTVKKSQTSQVTQKSQRLIA